MNKLTLKTLVSLLAGVLLTSAAQAGSHSLVNMSRSSTQSHVFVTQAIEAEFGKYRTLGGEDESSFWKGYGIRTSAGLELMKFIQFSAGHTFVNMREKNDGLQSLRGSRLNGEAKLVFYSPVGNLEGGMGVLASRLDFQQGLEVGDYYGSGSYYSLGLNYFVTGNLSFFGGMKMIKENLVKNGGASKIENIKTDTTSLGTGFSLWL